MDATPISDTYTGRLSAIAEAAKPVKPPRAVLVGRVLGVLVSLALMLLAAYYVENWLRWVFLGDAGLIVIPHIVAAQKQRTTE